MAIISAKELRALEKSLRKSDPNWRLTMYYARKARDEAEKLAKMGHNVDIQKLHGLIFGGGLKQDIDKLRQQVRQLTTVTEFNVKFDYATYSELKERLRRFNQAVKLHNERVMAEHPNMTIKQLRKANLLWKEKKWTISPVDNQTTADKWAKNILKNVTSANGYYGSLRAQYIDNLMKAIDRKWGEATQQNAGIDDDFKAFIRDMYEKHVPFKLVYEEGHEFLEYEYRSEKGSFIYRLRQLALQWGFVEEYDKYIEEHGLKV